MKTVYKTLAVALLLSPLTLTARSFAQQEESSPKRGVDAGRKGQAVQATTVYRTSTLKGMEVRNPQGEELGEIEELVIDLDEKKIRYAALSVGGVLGIGDKLLAVPIEALTLKHGEEEVYFLLDVDKAKLERAPGFSDDSWPEVGNPQWAASIDKYYGVTRQKSKLIRGTVGGVSQGQIAIAENGGKNRVYPVISDLPVTLDGDSSELEDLQKGQHVVATLETREGKPVITQVQASTKPLPRAGTTVAGRITEVTDEQFTVTDGQGREHTFRIKDRMEIVVNGEPASPERLEEGQRVEVTVQPADAQPEVARTKEEERL